MEDTRPRLRCKKDSLSVGISGVVDCGTHREFIVTVKYQGRKSPDGSNVSGIVGQTRRRYSEFRLLSQTMRTTCVPFTVPRDIIADTEQVQNERVASLSKYLRELMMLSSYPMPDELVEFLQIDARCVSKLEAAQCGLIASALVEESIREACDAVGEALIEETWVLAQSTVQNAFRVALSEQIVTQVQGPMSGNAVLEWLLRLLCCAPTD